MVRSTPPSQDVSTHQILNSYLKEYTRYGPDRKAGRTDSAITICLPKFLWGHKKVLLQNWFPMAYLSFLPGCVAQSVACLATDACLTADPGVASSIPARSHTFVEIDHEIISMVILLPSADSFKKGCCQ